MRGEPTERDRGASADSRGAWIVRRLREAGCVSAEAEADEILRAADGADPADLVERRAAGEPLAWIVGSTTFCGRRLRVDRGVFVPRPQTEALARRAVELLPEVGIAIDLCTGCGAVAAVLRAERPRATIVATDVDPVAVACARGNGVDARLGDLDDPLPRDMTDRVDLVTAVVPYVPSEELHLLPSDVLAFEPRAALDGGPGGLAMLRRAAAAAARCLGPGGSALFELGGDQAAAMTDAFAELGFDQVSVHRDEDGLDRAIEARRRT
jgi:release factor glutamine methyltransferase